MKQPPTPANTCVIWLTMQVKCYPNLKIARIKSG